MLPLQLLHVVLKQNQHLERIHPPQLLIPLPLIAPHHQIMGVPPPRRDADRQRLQQARQLEDVSIPQLASLNGLLLLDFGDVFLKEGESLGGVFGGGPGGVGSEEGVGGAEGGVGLDRWVVGEEGAERSADPSETGFFLLGLLGLGFGDELRA